MSMVLWVFLLVNCTDPVRDLEKSVVTGTQWRYVNQLQAYHLNLQARYSQLIGERPEVEGIILENLLRPPVSVNSKQFL
jgi:hypothetical protein